MNRKICFLIVMLFTLVLMSCNKVNNDVTPKTSVQASKEGKPEHNKVSDNNNQNSNESQVEINYKIIDTRYSDKEVTINYPQITNLSDDDKQKKVNKILKSEALSVLGFYEEGSNDVTLEINYRITWKSKNILSLQYFGVGNAKGAAHPLNLLYTVNININKGSKVSLKDYVNIDKNFVDNFRKYKVKDPEINQASASAFDYIIQTYSVEDLLRYFDGADSTYKNSAFTFSYFTKDAVGISIEVPHAVGDHMEIELKYEEIKNNIKTENDVWKELLNKPSVETINDGNKEDFNTIVNTLNEALNNISNKDLSHDERVRMTTKFVENLTKLLQNKESTKLSDEDLQKALDYNIVSKTNVQNINGTNVRIVRFDGSAEIFGTVERKWTYIQWWNDKEVHSQIIIHKGAEVTDDFFISEVKGVTTVTLAGYRTLYKPFPVFLSTWQLKNNKWEKINLFSNTIVSNDTWDIKVWENIITVESKNKDTLSVEMNQQKDGFEVFSEADSNKRIGFKLQGEQIIVQ